MISPRNNRVFDTKGSPILDKDRRPIEPGTYNVGPGKSSYVFPMNLFATETLEWRRTIYIRDSDGIPQFKESGPLRLEEFKEYSIHNSQDRN